MTKCGKYCVWIELPNGLLSIAQVTNMASVLVKLLEGHRNRISERIYISYLTLTLI
jgi:hypothetical protein